MNLCPSNMCQRYSGCEAYIKATCNSCEINVQKPPLSEGYACTKSSAKNVPFSAKLLKEGEALSLTPRYLGDPEKESIIQGAISTLVSMASMSNSPKGRSIFHSIYPPHSSIAEYVARLQRYLGFNAECYVLCVYYIDKLLTLHPNISFDMLSSHRMIMTSVVLAAKFHLNTDISNQLYSEVGGVSAKELNSLETYFLNLLDWNLTITEEQFAVYSTMLDSVSAAMGRQDSQ